jgi:hypothetical protein
MELNGVLIPLVVTGARRGLGWSAAWELQRPFCHGMAFARCVLLNIEEIGKGTDMKIFKGWNNTNAEIGPPPVPKKDFRREAKPEKNLPPLQKQNGKTNFARFRSIHGGSNSSSSQTSGLSSLANSRPSSTASGVHGQQSNFEKMVQPSIRRIDRSTEIDWDGFASQNPGLEKHVRAIQKISTKLNAMVIENMTKQIQPLPEYIADAEERSRPGIKQDAEKQIPTKLKDWWSRKNRENRTTKRDDVIKTKLNEVREGVITEQKNSIIRLEQNHPKSLDDECQMYFRSDEFNSGVPEALMELQQQLVEHAKNVVTGKLSASPANSLYTPSISTIDGFRSEAKRDRSPSVISYKTPVLSTLNFETGSAHDQEQSENSLNLSESSQPSSSQTEYYSTYRGSNSGNSTRAPSIISVESESGNNVVSGLHVPNQEEIAGQPNYSVDDKVGPGSSKPLPVSPEERAIDFLGGDKLDPRIKDFLQNRKLPDARLNHKGEAEWIKKEEE